MPTSQISHTTGQDSSWLLQNSSWAAQTFTTVAAITVTSVKVKLFRLGTVGTFTLRLEAVDGTGKPSGVVQGQGTFDASAVTLDGAGAWYDVDIADCNLTAATQYAIVCTVAATGSNYIYWLRDTSSGYAGGGVTVGADGITWGAVSGANDFMFDVWGDVSTEYVDMGGDIAGTGGIAGTLEIAETIDLAGAITGTGAISGTLSVTVSAGAGARTQQRLISCGNNQLWYEVII